MEQPKIKFSHNYPKLWRQHEGILLEVRTLIAGSLPPELIEYDTKYDGGYYALPKKGELLQLIFYGNKGIPFCTIRRKTPEKELWYKKNLDKVFKFVFPSTSADTDSDKSEAINNN